MLTSALPITLSMGTNPSEKRGVEGLPRLSPITNNRPLGHGRLAVVGGLREVGLVDRLPVLHLSVLGPHRVAGRADHPLDEVLAVGRCTPSPSNIQWKNPLTSPRSGTPLGSGILEHDDVARSGSLK